MIKGMGRSVQILQWEATGSGGGAGHTKLGKRRSEGGAGTASTGQHRVESVRAVSLPAYETTST